MLTTEQNKLIAEKLGLPKPCVIYKNCIVFGGKLKPKPCYVENNNKCVNAHTFDTWEGFRLIIENGPKQDWWEDFIHSSYYAFNTFLGDYKDEGYGWAIKQDYVGPKLAEELMRWIEEGEK